MSTPMSVAHAARMSGRSEKTIRRWIASGKLPAQKVDGVLEINRVDLARLVGDMSTPMSGPGGDTDVHPPTDTRLDILRAEAMAAYTRSLLEPLVTHVAALEGTIRDQAETIGRQAAELEAARARISTPEASGASHAGGSVPGPLLVRFRACAPWLLLAVILLLAVAVGQPVWVR